MRSSVARLLSVPQPMAFARALLLTTSFAVAIPVGADEYHAFLATVRWVPNNPEAVAAKDSLQSHFCDHFGISPCTPSERMNDGLHIISDLSIYIPTDQLSKVALFLSQWRTLVSRSNSLISIRVTPVNSNGKAVEELSAQFGGWDHIVANGPNNHTQKASIAGVIDSLGDATSEPWTHQCTWSDICSKPYTSNTTCSAEVDAWHVHVQYSPNDLLQVRARDAFKALGTKHFNMAWADRCIDHQVEDKQPRLCWLTGPQGHDPVYPDHAGGSFVTVTFSIYVPAANFSRVLPWLMRYRNEQYIGASLDMMIHPESGCAWPDHIFWPLLLGHRWDANHYGVAREAKSLPPFDKKQIPVPVSDSRGSKWVERPPQNCSTSTPSSYTLLVQYSPESRAEAEATLQRLRKFWLQRFGTEPQLKDMPQAYLDVYSACAGPCASVVVDKKLLGALLAALPDIRQVGVDFRLVPNGSGCRWREFMDFSLQIGDARWALNEFAIQQGAVVHKMEAEAEVEQTGDSPAYIMYIIGEQANAWSNASLLTFAESFSTAFNVKRGECFPWLAEPKEYGDSLTNVSRVCMMEEAWSPYKDAYAMFPTVHVPIYIPGSSLPEILPWVLQHRHADKVGYELDIALVPLTGNATHDYYESFWWSGSKWRINQYAVELSMNIAPAEQVRFYKNAEARHVEEDGLTRLEWQSRQQLGELDLAMGDPSVTTLDLKKPFPPSADQQMRFEFDFQYVILEGSCNFTISCDNAGHQDTMVAGDMIWIRAGVAHRITPLTGASQVMAVGGPWKPRYVDFNADMVYNYYEDPNAEGPPSLHYNNSWFRSYHLNDEQWFPNPSIPKHLSNKGFGRSADNDDDVAYLAVKWDAYQWLPRHTHATGAFYIILSGSMHFPGEGGVGKFEARWTAPGHYYAGERSLGEGALIVVLGADTPPQFVDVPPEGQNFQHNLEEKRRNMHHVFEDPAGVIVPLKADGFEAPQHAAGVKVSSSATKIFI